MRIARRARARGRQVFAALGARGIVVDWRTPDIIRVAPVPLYNGYEDAWQFAQALAAVLRAVSERRRALNIVGAGLAGALLALMLARRGLKVTPHERRPDPRQSQPERGRSINLALAARGLAALEAAGMLDEVRPLLIPMRGRQVHEVNGESALLPYGQRPARGHLLGQPRGPEPRADRCGRAPRRGAGALQPRAAWVSISRSMSCAGATRRAARSAVRAHAHDRHRRRGLRHAHQPEHGRRAARHARTGSIMTTRN